MFRVYKKLLKTKRPTRKWNLVVLLNCPSPTVPDKGRSDTCQYIAEYKLRNRSQLHTLQHIRSELLRLFATNNFS